MSKLVLQDWLENLSLKQQTVLIVALRGCDTSTKHDNSKKLTRMLRSDVLKNAATPNTKFMNISRNWNIILDFRNDIDSYPVHYFLHLIHAIEIIGYFHPDREVRDFWNKAYLLLIDAMHVSPESKETNAYRLMDGVDSE